MLFKFSFSHGGGRRLGALHLVRLSAAAATTSSSPPITHHFIADYLISRLGFSAESATKASKLRCLSRLESLERPESFMGFMRSHGFSDAHIEKIVSSHPKYLAVDAQKTLAPKFKSFSDLGFSGPEIVHLVLSNRRILYLDLDRVVVPRIRFWESLLGSRAHLVRLLMRHMSNFLENSIESGGLMQNLDFLRRCSVSDQRIAKVVRHSPWFILRRPQDLVAAAERVENEMGVARSSGMFLLALRILTSVSKDKFVANMKFMRSFGWSDAEFLSAFSKAPTLLCLTRKTLKKKMEFLVKEVGCNASDVARSPVLLLCSLEERLIPRHRVMKLLNSTGLIKRELQLYPIMIPSEKRFVEKNVVPYMDKIPELQKIYTTYYKRKMEEADYAT